MIECHLTFPRKRGAMKLLNVGSDLVVRNTYRTDHSYGTHSCILEQYFTRNTEDSEILYHFRRQVFYYFLRYGEKYVNQSCDLFCWKIKWNWYFKAVSEVQRQVADSESFEAEIWRMNRKYVSKTAKFFLQHLACLIPLMLRTLGKHCNDSENQRS